MLTLLKSYETYLKIAVILIYTLFIWHCHSIYDTAKEVKVEQKQVIQAEQGTKEVIKFHQQLEKIYVKVKEPCLNTPIPADINKLLK